MAKPPARQGISWQKRILRGFVPEGTFLAASAGDSPFEDGAVLKPGTPLARPVPAWWWPGVPEEPEIPFDYRVLFRDAEIIVVDKPHFLPVTSNGRIVVETVQTRLRIRENNPYVVPLHRLDRLTAGLVLCSANPATRGIYQRLFEERKVEKCYEATVAKGSLEGLPIDEHWRPIELGMEKQGRRVVVSDGPRARRTLTRIRRVGEDRVGLAPLTGHTHQLRVLMNYLGAPILGDDSYPEDTGRGFYDFSVPLELFAVSLSFRDPLNNSVRAFRRARLDQT